MSSCRHDTPGGRLPPSLRYRGLMLRYRQDLAALRPYVAGKSAADLDSEGERIIKLASNECPHPPFPEVQAAIADAVAGINRYPDTQARSVRGALGEWLGVPTDHLWFGAGGSEIVTSAALALGGPGTNIVFASPSFVLYEIAARRSMAESVQVSLDADHRLDLEAMRAAIDADTTLVYVCNPNNPTGTHLSAASITEFVNAIPESVLVFVDEAYGEYATAADYSSAVPLAIERPNVLVMRTFSKIFGLAGLRIGYAVAQPETIAGLSRVQRPFTITDLAQRAAAAALALPDRLRERIEENAAERSRLEAELDARSISHPTSQANFIYFEPHDAATVAKTLQEMGVIPRQLGDGLRVTIGTATENDRFLEALDIALKSS